MFPMPKAPPCQRICFEILYNADWMSALFFWTCLMNKLLLTADKHQNQLMLFPNQWWYRPSRHLLPSSVFKPLVCQKYLFWELLQHWTMLFILWTWLMNERSFWIQSKHLTTDHQPKNCSSIFTKPLETHVGAFRNVQCPVYLTCTNRTLNLANYMPNGRSWPHLLRNS